MTTLTVLEALRKTTESIKAWVESKFLKKDEVSADDFGVYVQPDEPVDAVDDDIWIDTASDPSVMVQDIPVQSVNGMTGVITLPVLPDVTTADNGKVLMVVDGAWAVVDINLAVDADGVLSV